MPARWRPTLQQAKLPGVSRAPVHSRPTTCSRSPGVLALRGPPVPGAAAVRVDTAAARSDGRRVAGVGVCVVYVPCSCGVCVEGPAGQAPPRSVGRDGMLLPTHDSRWLCGDDGSLGCSHARVHTTEHLRLLLWD